MSHPSRTSKSSATSQRRDRRALPPKRRRRSPLVLLGLVVLWSLLMGLGLAQATEKPTALEIAQASTQVSSQVVAQAGDRSPAPAAMGTVDVITRKHQLGHDLYLENCASCHIGVPPAVLPTETWRQLIQDPQHYGARLDPLVDPARLLVWNYLRTYSRLQDSDEETPYRLRNSRFFKVLHPRVKFSQPINLKNCATCHIGASQFNFRQLSPEWQNSP